MTALADIVARGEEEETLAFNPETLGGIPCEALMTPSLATAAVLVSLSSGEAATTSETLELESPPRGEGG